MKVTIPTPCHEDWNTMTAAEQGKHCAVCDKVVKDFSRMKDEEIMQVISASTEKICGHFHINQLQPAGFAQRVSFSWKKLVHGKILLPLLAYFSLHGAAKSQSVDMQLDGMVVLPERRETNSEPRTVYIKVRRTGSNEVVPYAAVTISLKDGRKANLFTDIQGVARYVTEPGYGAVPEIDITVSDGTFSEPREYKDVRLTRKETTLMVYLEDDHRLMMKGEIAPNYIEKRTDKTDTICTLTEVEVTEPPPVIDTSATEPEVKQVLFPADSAEESGNWFTLFPNPGNGLFTVSAVQKPEEAMYRVFDMEGKQLLSGEIRDRIFTVNMEQYAAGTYLLIILQKGVAVETRKIVIAQ